MGPTDRGGAWFGFWASGAPLLVSNMAGCALWDTQHAAAQRGAGAWLRASVGHVPRMRGRSVGRVAECDMSHRGPGRGWVR